LDIKLSIYFIDHLNRKEKIDNKIVDVEDGVLTIQEGRLYQTLSFTVNSLFISPSAIGDLEERIELKYKIDNNEETTLKFVIDNIEYLEDNNIKIFAKTRGIKYSFKYSGNINSTIPCSGLKDLISLLLINEPLNLDKLMDTPFLFDYEIKDKSIEEAIEDLSNTFGFNYYVHKGIIYFEDIKTIEKDEAPIKKFKGISDILNINTTTNKDEKKISVININTAQTEDIVATPKINLDIKNSPQCCSPDEVLIFTTDSGDVYKINPVNAQFIVYYTPTIKPPACNVPHHFGDRILIEKFKLKNDEFVELAGGIEEVLAIEGVNNYTYKTGFNVVAFDFTEDGELNITYRTKVLYGTIGHSRYPKSINFKIKHFDQILEYEHKIELNGYYPIPYNFTLNLMSDWGIDYADAINRTVYIDGIPHQSDIFGNLTFAINEYKTIKFEITGHEPLYLDWYVNVKKIYMHEEAT